MLAFGQAPPISPPPQNKRFWGQSPKPTTRSSCPHPGGFPTFSHSPPKGSTTRLLSEILREAHAARQSPIQPIASSSSASRKNQRPDDDDNTTGSVDGSTADIASPSQADTSPPPDAPPSPCGAQRLVEELLLSDEDGPRSGIAVARNLGRLTSEGVASLGETVSRAVEVAEQEVERLADLDRLKEEEEDRRLVEAGWKKFFPDS